MAQERCFKRVCVSIMPVEPWDTRWTRKPADWVDSRDSLRKAFATFKEIEDEVPILQEYAKQFGKLNEMPWLDIACKIANGVNRSDARLESANDIMSLEELREYVEEWRRECKSVDDLISWQFFPHTTAAKTLAEFSRLGAYEQPFLC